MEKIVKVIASLAEYGALHNEDCCVNFPEDNRACDVGTPELGCCENMAALAIFAEELVKATTEYLSHDITFDGEEQRKSGVELYNNHLKVLLRPLVKQVT